jgi:glycosyltransferase involved in cell wall biosynthesis
MSDMKQFLRAIGAPQPSMSVIPMGARLPDLDESQVSKEIKRIGAKRFILYVSTIERRKNHETLYKAYINLIESGYTDLPIMVFVGMVGWGVSDLLADLKLDPRIQDKILVLDRVNDHELVFLYTKCLFTVFPSLYEGWGLAVSESLAYGKFCLCSNAASLPEAGLDFVEYLDPWDVMGWTERLHHYIRNADELALKSSRIRDEFQCISWNKTAETMFEVLSSL